MSFKIALFAALCVAQCIAFRPSFESDPRNIVCKDTAGEISYDFEEVVNQIDEVRESVTVAAMDAYAKGSNFGIVIACFRAQKGSYVALGERVSKMIRAGSQEMAQKMIDTAEKYAKLMEVPLNTIAVTMRTLPQKVYNYLKEKEFTKAVEVIRESRKIVRENGRQFGEYMQQMVKEVPPMADRVEEIAKEIREEAKNGSEAIRKAFGKCIEEGGPKSIEVDGE